MMPHFMYLLAPVLVFWIWGIAQEISRLEVESLTVPASLAG
jgi:hypothetical protein